MYAYAVSTGGTSRNVRIVPVRAVRMRGWKSAKGMGWTLSTPVHSAPPGASSMIVGNVNPRSVLTLRTGWISRR